MENTVLKGITYIRNFIYGGAVQLPLTLAGTLLILGLFSANYAALFLLFGFLILVPFTVQFVLNLPFSFLIGAVPSLAEYFTVRGGGDICRILPSHRGVQNSAGGKDDTRTEVFSTWMAMITFFTGYLATNALGLINHEAPPNQVELSRADEQTKTPPKRSMKFIGGFSLAMIVLFGLVCLFLRIRSGCESIATTLITVAPFFYLGHAWYLLLSEWEEGRVSDLFGVANRLLPPSAIANGPIACIPFQDK